MDPADVLGAIGKLMPLSGLVPRVPKIAERTTGQVMGEAAEDMARQTRFRAPPRMNSRLDCISARRRPSLRVGWHGRLR